MVTPQAVRRWILTASVTAITVTGAIYGAGLKTQQEHRQEKRKIQEATPEERIAQLETARADLIRKKNEFERKIADVAARRLAKEQDNSGAK